METTFQAVSGSNHRPPLATPRFAIVGCGKVGHVHRERLLAAGVEIVAVCDPDADALARMANALPQRPRLFRSEQDLLTAGVADAVVLCTPHSLHGAQTRACLDAGIHVLCEKPFVTDAAEGRELVELAQFKNLALFVSYTRRSRGHARFLKEAISKIGPLTHVVINRAQPWFQLHYRTWRMHSNGGGFLLDTGSSVLDLLLRLVDGSPVTHQVVEFMNRGVVDVDIRSSLILEFANGVRADFTLIGDATEETEHIELYGLNGTAGWQLREDKPGDLYLREAGKSSVDIAASGHRIPLPDAAFVAALRAGGDFTKETSEHPHSAASALPVIELVQSFYENAVWRTLAV